MKKATLQKLVPAARVFYDSLKSRADLLALINDGETEGIYLECKAPSHPHVNKDTRAKLARAISGFANSAGGVILWGISTTKHAHSGLDVLTQLEPIANCKGFMQQVQRAVVTGTTPWVQGVESRIILEKANATRGIVVTYVPASEGDPVRSNEDDQFYFRSGDDFSVAPYALIKRLFAASDSPDLSLAFSANLVSTQADGTWRLPIVITNRSSATAETVKLSVIIENPESCESVQLPEFSDASSFNPGIKIFIRDAAGAIHRGMNHVVGTLIIKMKREKRVRRIVKFKVNLLANRMRGRCVSATVSLTSKGFAVTNVSEAFLY